MMNKIAKNALQQSRPIFEEMEERRLFSGGVEGLIDLELDLDSEANAIYRDLDTGVTQTGQPGTGATDAEGQSHEIAFVDAGVDNYQLLIDDLLSNADTSRNIEVVLLERDQNGIERISTILKERDDLDAIHIISHGTDGSIELGASRLDAASLEENNLSIALWANAFAEFGDILIYGCNLAASEVGQSLIDELSDLTMADVAASDDLTGADSLGGDWVLEASTGAIESTVAVSEQVQQSWEHVLTPAGYPDSNGQDNSFEWITNVSFAGIDNTSGQEGGGYGDYSGQIGSIEQGEAALLSVTISADSQDYVNAWIDWNGDGDFTDAGEGYVLATNTGSNGPHTLMITAPNDAAVGTAILRVSLKYQGAAASDEVFQYGEVEDYSINVTAAGDQPPTDIVANGTEGGGLGLNDDGGNDAYLQADDGGAILGGLTSLTLESQFSITTQSADETTLLSYASSGSDNEVKLIIQSSGEIALSIGSSTQVTAASYPTLVDGQRHQVSASWDSATGAVAFYVDGVVVESFSGFQTGYTIASGGTLLFGQEQDAVGGGFETADQFQGALYDVRIFDDVRSGAEVASGYNATLSYDEGGLTWSNRLIPPS